MYLTRLLLNPRGQMTRRDLACAYEMHRTLSRVFAPSETEPPSRFLWRLELYSQGRMRPQVLVQSEREGSWARLQALPNYLQEPDGLQTKDVALDRVVVKGGVYRFRLVANPTVKREGRRYGLAGEEQQLAWLRRQGEQHGFQIQDVLISSDDQLVIRHAKDEAITVRSVCFEGRLAAMDIALMRSALVTGIGPAKAFGCGLLSIAPILPA